MVTYRADYCLLSEVEFDDYKEIAICNTYNFTEMEIIRLYGHIFTNFTLVNLIVIIYAIM